MKVIDISSRVHLTSSDTAVLVIYSRYWDISLTLFLIYRCLDILNTYEEDNSKATVNNALLEW